MVKKITPLPKSLLDVWHPTKNGEISSDVVSAGSGRDFWWQCEKGHEWQAKPLNLRRTGNCPVCSNKLLLQGSNDLTTLFPQIAFQWHSTKNGSLTPSEVTSGYRKKVWWVCDKNHEWEATVAARVRSSSGCPFCAGQRPLIGETDLATTHPKIAKEFHPTKNTITVQEIKSGTSKKIWWLGLCGHEWEATPYNRVKGSDCPYCSRNKVDKGINDLGTLYPELAKEWHPTKNEGLQPENFLSGSNKKVWWICEKGHEWQAYPYDRTSKKTGCPVCTNRVVLQGFNDLASLKPNLAAQWSSKNVLQSTQVSVRAGKKVWWVCDKNHEWEATVANRTAGSGCPFCANQRVLTGYNDLATTHPHLAKEWHPTKNGSLEPTKMGGQSESNVWWLGKCGHEWRNRIKNRAGRDNTGCPFCANQQVLTGYNDLATTHPHLAKEWHPTKNGLTLPDKMTYGSNKSIWWKCEKGHEWRNSPHNRTKRDQGCPICSGQKVLTGYNDLATTHPHLAKEWHPTKNTLDATSAHPGSNLKRWWVCEKGHEWQTRPADRTYKGNNCPNCAASTFVSGAEKEIAQYVGTLGLDIATSVRNIIKGELDIYVPEKKTAIEFNGIYWHNEFFVSSDYHQTKNNKCKEKGIRLIQIWEDDWKRKPELVKKMLAHKLGATVEPKVFARKTNIRELTQAEANGFLDKNHIQGSVTGGIRVGLFHQIVGNPLTNEALVAIMVLKREPGTEGRTLNLLRFATSQPVVGGFTKLLKYVENLYSPESIITFSDNMVSDGGLYETTGFIPVKEIKPDYMYVVRNKRVHKFNYRLKRFRDDPELLFEEGLSERELADLNGLNRIWDAGKTKWVKELRTSNSLG